MRRLIGILGFIYIISAIVLVPILIQVIWAINFPPAYLDRTTATFGAFKIVAWLIGGIVVLNALRKLSLARLYAKVRSVAPKNFKPSFELIGEYLTEYIGVAPIENQLVIIDLKKGKAHYGPINLIQGWDIEERGLRTTLVIRFNDFDISSVKFDIPRKSSDDIASNLTFATR